MLAMGDNLDASGPGHEWKGESPLRRPRPVAIHTPYMLTVYGSPEDVVSETLGGFEHQVLLAMLRLGGETYSVPIVGELEGMVGRTAAPAAVYVTLRRLERRGLLTSHMAPPGAGEGGRPRRVFRVEPKAVDTLRSVRDDLTRLWSGIEVLEP